MGRPMKSHGPPCGRETAHPETPGQSREPTAQGIRGEPKQLGNMDVSRRCTKNGRLLKEAPIPHIGVTRLELVTSWPPSRHSTKLSYTPFAYIIPVRAGCVKHARCLTSTSARTYPSPVQRSPTNRPRSDLPHLPGRERSRDTAAGLDRCRG